MTIASDRLEQERLDRQAAIRKALEENDGANSTPTPKAETKAGRSEASSRGDSQTASETKVQHYCGRPLFPWEVLVKGRPIQYRPMTSREVEAMDERTMMESIKRQDDAHQRKVQAAIRERDAEQKDMDKRREHETTTGKRPYGEKRFISLEQARREGYLQSENASNGKPEHWSPGNPDGILCGGR